MLNHVSFADNSEWNDLLNAIRSGGGGGGGSPISIDSTQWQALLDEVEKGDITALATLLTAISGTLAQMKLALDSVVIDNSQWNALITAISRSIVTADITQNSTQWSNLISAFSSVGIEQDTTQFNSLINAIQSQQLVGIEQDTTQWTNLINAISNQQIGVNLNNINTDNTQNNSSFNGSSLTSVLNVIYNTLFNPDTNIVKWTKVSTFSQFDVYCFKIGIIKILWIDTAKAQISSGWQSGGVGNLPTGYEALLDPVMSVNKTLRNATQMFITVNATGNLNINPSATITSGYAIRQSFMYI